MRNKLLIIALILTQQVWSNDFHTFTGKDGKSIKARIIRVDPIRKKVELKRENGKTFCVGWGIFTAEDQSYIANWRETSGNSVKSTSRATQPKPLTTKKIKSVVNKHGIALIRNDYEEYSSQCVNPINKADFASFTILSFKVRKCRKNNAQIEFKVKFLSGPDLMRGMSIVERGWVQLTGDGKIKYHPSYNYGGGLHPMLSAMFSLSSLFSCDKSIERPISKKRIKEILAKFDDLGIPTFGYSMDLPKDDREEALEEILDWMKDNHREWDSTDPKIPCPPEAFKERLDELEDLRR